MKCKLIIVFLLLLGFSATSQNAKDSIGGLKRYPDVITSDAISFKGLITVHNVKEKTFFEIDRNLLNKEILVVTRISKSASGSTEYAGDELSNFVIRFDRLGSRKLTISKVKYKVYNADSTSNLFQAVTRSNLMPIVASIPLETLGKDSSLVINVSDLIAGDNELFSFSALNKISYRLGTFFQDKSFSVNASSFPKNTEITSLKTYAKNFQTINPDGSGIISYTENVSYEINTSFVALPEVPMKQRFSDDRVGYFSIDQVDFDAISQGVATRSFVKRWRMVPRSKDLEKYQKGETVVPEQPIKFYIDPATPEKWVPYLIQGVNDWQRAFEAAGFKNAIYAVKAPTKQEDPSWNLYDARHSAIIYKPSPIENASGPSISDPRTGEILESHINWYHNVMQLVHDWYFLQCGVQDTAARHMEFSDSLMGQLIRFVVSHEVGHTLGLRHNMGASTSVPVEKLRDEQWLKENGICPSIMDYARFNYVAQPEDKLSRASLLPKIGVYDKWAIDWGYRYFPEYPTPESEKTFLNNRIIETTKDIRFRFISEGNYDVRNKMEDLGDNAVQASEYGIRNLKRIVPKLIEWTKVPNEDYTNLHHMYLMLQRQFRTYLGHVVSVFANGAVTEDLKSVDQQGAVYKPVPFAKIKAAYDFINANVFTTPEWILDTNILYRTGQPRLGVIGNIQEINLRSMLNPYVFSLFYSRNGENFPESDFSLNLYLGWLRHDVFTELDKDRTVDPFRKNLQIYYIKYVIELFNKMKPNGLISLPATGFTETYHTAITALVYAHIKQLESDLTLHSKTTKDKNTKYHFEYLADKIKMELKEKSIFGY